MKKYDLIIIGAGPVGLSCAIEAKRAGLSYMILEKGVLTNSIYKFPVNMKFFTTASLLEIGEHPFPSTLDKPSRVTSLDYYRLVTSHENLEINLFHKVASVEGSDNEFLIKGYLVHPSGKDAGNIFEFTSSKVILATGYFDNPIGLGNVKGGDLPHVSLYYDEPHGYFNQNVVIIGGGNSGAEAALELYRHGAKVFLVHKNQEPRKTIKYWVATDLKNRLKNGEITPIMPAKVIEIKRDIVVLEYQNKITEIEADAVFILTGFLPDLKYIEKIGLIQNEDNSLNLTTNYETQEPGLFAVGSVAFGKLTNYVFIENGREHAKIAIEEIQKQLKDKNHVPSRVKLIPIKK